MCWGDIVPGGFCVFVIWGYFVSGDFCPGDIMCGGKLCRGDFVPGGLWVAFENYHTQCKSKRNTDKGSEKVVGQFFYQFSQK